MLLVIFIQFICVFFKILFLLIIDKKNIDLSIKKYAGIIIFYDITTDIANFIICNIEPFDRPYWHNLFIGLGMILYLSKVHCEILICDYFSKKNSYTKKQKIFITLISTFIGLFKFFCFLNFCVKNNFSTVDILPIDRNIYEYYLSKIGDIFYSRIILFMPIYNLYKSLEYDETSDSYKKELKIFLVFGIFLKFIIDSFPGAIKEFIEFIIFNSEQPFYTASTAQIVSLISIFCFFIYNKFFNYIERVNEFYYFFEYIEKNNREKRGAFVLDDERLLNKPFTANPVREIFTDSVKKTISLRLKIKEDLVFLETKFDNDNKNYNIILNNDLIFNYIYKNKFIYLDHLLDYFYFNKNEQNSDINIDLLKSLIDIMNHCKYRVIIAIENNSEIIGFLIIKKSDSYYEKYKLYNKEFVYLVSLKYVIDDFNNKLGNEINHNVALFRIDMLQEQIKKLKVLQSELLRNVEKIFSKINFGIYFYSEKKKIWINKILKDDDTETKLNEKISSCKNIDEIILTEQNNLILGQEIKSIKPKYRSIILINIPSFKINDNSKSSALYLTDMGMILDDIIYGNDSTIVKYKEKMLEIYNNIDPYILYGNIQETSVFLKIISIFSERECIIYDLKNEDVNLILIKIFNYMDEYSARGKNVLLVNIDFLEKIYQRKIIEKYIDYINYTRIDKSCSDIRVFLSIPKLNMSYFIDDFIYKIFSFIEIEDPKINVSTRKNKINFIKFIAKAFFNKDLDEDKVEMINEKLEDSFDKIYGLTELVNFIKNIIENDITFMAFSKDLYVHEDIIQKAILLGKAALKDEYIMANLFKMYKNKSDIAKLLGVNKSTITRFYKKEN